MKTFVCKEEGCHKSFVHREHLSRHRLNHNPRKIFSCTACPKKFVRLDLLQRHKARHERGMVYRASGGIVNITRKKDDTPIETITLESETSSSSLQNTTILLAEDEVKDAIIPSLDAVSPELAPEQQQLQPKERYHKENGSDDTFGLMLYESPPGVNSLFFDVSNDIQFPATDLDWLLEDPSGDQTGHGEISSWLQSQVSNTLDNPIPYEQQTFQDHWTSPESLWATVRSRLLAQLITIPHVHNTSFFEPANLAMFYDLYFGTYHPMFPMLHLPTLSPLEAPPFLILSIVAIGSILAPSSEYFDVAGTIIEAVRWLIFSSPEFKAPAPLWVLQTLLIVQAHEKMGSTRVHHERSHIFHGSIITLMKRGSAYSSRQTTEPTTTSASDTSLLGTWHRWIEIEASKRTAFFAFLMDAQHSTLFGHKPILSLGEIRLQLPCAESLWDCPTPEQWATERRHTPEQPTFLNTLKGLINRAPVPPICSAYSRSLLLHGLMSVTAHMHMRDATTVDIGLSKATTSTLNALTRESSTASPASSNTTLAAATANGSFDWRDVLDRATSTWSFALCSQSPSLALEAASPLLRIAYASLYLNIIDFHIVAGAPSLVGNLLSRADYTQARNRLRAWSKTPGARKALFHCLLLVKETVFTGKVGGYKAREDNLAVRPWCLYHATLILWVFGHMTEGREMPATGGAQRGGRRGAEVGAEEYLVRMMSALAMDNGGGATSGSGGSGTGNGNSGGSGHGSAGTSSSSGGLPPLVGANCTTGMVKVVRDCLEGCEWELLQEAHATLGKLVGISPGVGVGVGVVGPRGAE